MSAPLPTMRQLFAEVALEYGLTEAELRQQSRKRYISWPRQDFMWRARQVRRLNGMPRFTLPQVGRFLGGMDHTSIIWGIDRHVERIAAAEARGVSVQDYIRGHMPPRYRGQPGVCGTRWSADEDRTLLWATSRGVGLKHICSSLGRSYSSVYCRRKRLGRGVRSPRTIAGAVNHQAGEARHG